MTLVLLVAGFALLLAGADVLVRGASSLAALARISPLVIGLTVVAAGTSAPEVAISVNASLGGQPDLAVGNVVGSNIFNVLLVLGMSALIAPLMVQQQLIRFDVPLMVALSVAVLLLSLDGSLSRIECGVLLAVMLLYTAILIRGSRKESLGAESELQTASPAGSGILRSVLRSSAFVGTGLALLVIGSRWLVESATTIAETLGVSELVIGLTVVAAGTSLPEVATSVLAAIKGERDMAVGNVVGSCILNLLLVLGLAGLVSSGGLPVASSVRSFDLPVMTVVAFACLPIFFTGRLIARWEGVVFLFYYIAYTAYVVLDATDHDSLTTYTTGMVFFILPLTALTLIVVVGRTLRASSLARKRPAHQ